MLTKKNNVFKETDPNTSYSHRNPTSFNYFLVNATVNTTFAAGKNSNQTHFIFFLKYLGYLLNFTVLSVKLINYLKQN